MCDKTMVFQSGCCRLPKTHCIFSAFTIIASKLPASTEGEAARSSSWLHAIKVPLCLVRLWLKISNQHVPKTPKLTLPTAHASGPCFASTFTTPFGNFRISWDNNRTILFESVVSHQTKLDANQKKKGSSKHLKKRNHIYPTCILFVLWKKVDHHSHCVRRCDSKKKMTCNCNISAISKKAAWPS